MQECGCYEVNHKRPAGCALLFIKQHRGEVSLGNLELYLARERTHMLGFGIDAECIILSLVHNTDIEIIRNHHTQAISVRLIEKKSACEVTVKILSDTDGLLNIETLALKLEDSPNLRRTNGILWPTAWDLIREVASRNEITINPTTLTASLPE